MNEDRPPPQGLPGRVLTVACEAAALAGGAIVAVLALLSIVSIIGRNFFATPIQGDFELVQLGCAVAIALFLPWCQLRRGNIIVDFFTTNATPRVRGILDAAGALAVAVVMALLAWRTGLAAISMRDSRETSMIMGLPLWFAYLAMTPAFALTALAGVHAAWQDIRGR